MSPSTPWSGKAVLVTGGAGFIGSHLVDRLVREGAQVTVLDNFSTGTRQNLKGSPCSIVQGSIGDAAIVEKLAPQMDVVFHLAARPSVSRSIEDPWESHEANITGSMVLLEAFRRSKRLKAFVNTSSSSVYGDSPELPKEEDRTGRPLSPYALQKATVEHYVRLYAELYGFPGVSVRPFNIFGPRQSPESLYAAVIPKFIDQALQGKDLHIHGDGEQTRDFTHVDNMVELFLRASERASEQKGQAFNAGAGQRHTVKQLADLVVEFAKSKSKVVLGPPRPGDIRDSLASLKKAERLLGYKPLVSFRDGLESLVRLAKEKA